MMRINIRNLYYRTMLLFPITTLFQLYFDNINKILLGFLFALQL